MLISKQELVELSGYKQPAAQIRWLTRMGITFFVNGDGHPITSHAHIDSVLSGNSKYQKAAAGYRSPLEKRK